MLRASRLLTGAIGALLIVTPAQAELLPVEPSGFQHFSLEAGVDLSQYQAIALLPCDISFHKNWQRNQNSNALNSRRMRDRDVEQQRDNMASVCERNLRKQFIDDGYEVVSTEISGPQILLVKPIITELDIRAPDLNSTNIERQYVNNVGEMTLELGLYHSENRKLLGQANDWQEGWDFGYPRQVNRTTNNAEFGRMFRSWASALTKLMSPES
ncbi:hypothetical protein [Ferrimonas pelagia]|uniref:DUF3313 domain-containing protein n=1 Tax=Ferrimonas pelagia TaxID=1177826 RepID=A0ABP9EBI2_9GAMM